VYWVVKEHISLPIGALVRACDDDSREIVVGVREMRVFLVRGGWRFARHRCAPKRAGGEVGEGV